MTLAEAKGLKPRRIFLRYAMRNAILPQMTALALSLGQVVSGVVLVEVVFGISRSRQSPLSIDSDLRLPRHLWI